MKAWVIHPVFSGIVARRPNIFIVDDDPGIRASLDSVLRSDGFCVRTFESADAFLAFKVPDEPGCLLLDLRLPGMNGLALQEELIRTGVHLPIIFMTAHGGIADSVRAVKAGAVDFLCKPFSYRSLLSAIELALETDQFARSQHDQACEFRARLRSLTPRERQVMRLVVEGRLTKQIAGELGTREVTVKIQRGSVMRKMGAGSVAELARMVERLGIGGDG